MPVNNRVLVRAIDETNNAALCFRTSLINVCNCEQKTRYSTYTAVQSGLEQITPYEVFPF